MSDTERYHLGKNGDEVQNEAQDKVESSCSSYSGSESENEDGDEGLEGESMDDEGNEMETKEQEVHENKERDTQGDASEDVNLLTLTPTQVKDLQFHNSDSAYAFYNEYGRLNGFGIRRSKVVRNKHKEIICVRFLCNRAGFRDQKHVENSNGKRKHRPLTRCGCAAELRVKLNSSTGMWYVGTFCDDHNHQLLGQKCMGLARSHWKMSDANKKHRLSEKQHRDEGNEGDEGESVDNEGNEMEAKEQAVHENEQMDTQEDALENIDILRLTPAHVKDLKFHNSDSAYAFYNEYGRLNGFGIRRSKVVRNKHKEIICVRFLCNRAGFRDQKHVENSNGKSKHRPLTRCGCAAELRVKLDSSTGIWYVGTFCDDHNHQLVGQKSMGLPLSQWKMSDADKKCRLSEKEDGDEENEVESSDNEENEMEVEVQKVHVNEQRDTQAHAPENIDLLTLTPPQFKDMHFCNSELVREKCTRLARLHQKMSNVEMKHKISEIEDGDARNEGDEGENTDNEGSEMEAKEQEVHENEEKDTQGDALENIDLLTLTPAQFKDLQFRNSGSAYVFYKEYGRLNGFRIRRSKVGRNKHKEIIWVRFVCNRAGYRDRKHVENLNRKRKPRALSRCGCAAELRVKLNSSTGMWYVGTFCDDHNHQLVGEMCMGLARLHRTMSNADIKRKMSKNKDGDVGNEGESSDNEGNGMEAKEQEVHENEEGDTQRDTQGHALENVDLLTLTPAQFNDTQFRNLELVGEKCMKLAPSHWKMFDAELHHEISENKDGDEGNEDEGESMDNEGNEMDAENEDVDEGNGDEGESMDNEENEMDDEEQEVHENEQRDTQGNALQNLELLRLTAAQFMDLLFHNSELVGEKYIGLERSQRKMFNADMNCKISDNEDGDEGNEGDESESVDNEGNEMETEEQEVHENEERHTQGDALKNIDFSTLTPAQFKDLQFHNSNSAYVFYKEYGRLNGFGIRRSKVGRNKNKEIIWVRFVCNRAGYRDRKHVENSNRKRKPRALSRCGCAAELRVKLNSSTGMWHVGTFCDDHNHQLAAAKCMELTRSRRRVSNADMTRKICENKDGDERNYGKSMDNEGHEIKAKEKEVHENEERSTQGDALENIDLLTVTPAQFKDLQFRSSDSAYVFYNEYGRLNGFGIRRSKVGRNKHKQIISVRFICNRAGFREQKHMENLNCKRKHRALSRCGCAAALHVRLNSSTGMWYVRTFCDDHNHQLVGEKCMGLGRSHRKISNGDMKRKISENQDGDKGNEGDEGESMDNEGNETEVEEEVHDNEERDNPGHALRNLDLLTLTPTQFKGLQFLNSESAYVFYSEYGRLNGFGIRRSKVGRNRHKEIIWVRFVCNRAGYRDRKHVEKSNCKRKHIALSRCGCAAELRVRLNSSTGMWYVGNLCDDHNHQLVGEKCTALAQSHR